MGNGDEVLDATKQIKIFDNSNQALRDAKKTNDIPLSKQPDKTIKPNTPEGQKVGLNKNNVKQYEYTNNKGVKVGIRQDKTMNYKDGGKQNPHFNSGKKDESLKKHHYYKEKKYKEKKSDNEQ